jgi:undecaprenyl diphosphate synthase
MNLPEHIAIIMDGNGRWATRQGLSRSEGHREGSLAIDRLMDSALELNLSYISLYAFSTENWKRPIAEIKAIFNLLDEFISTRLEFIKKKNIKILHSGSETKVPLQSMKQIKKAIEETSKNTGLVINFCLNYGSQDEILNAVGKLIKNRIEKQKDVSKPIKKEELEKFLYTYPLPDVDLLIRTAGEQRISNFLLWQSAYAEMYFTETLWPEFDKKELSLALEWYGRRIRKYGGVVS